MTKELTKQCTKCGEILPVSEFGKKSTNKDGLQTQCKKCVAEYQRGVYHKKKQALEALQSGNITKKPDLKLVQPTQYTQDAQVVQVMQPVQQSQGASDLQIFNNDEFGNVRVVQIEGEPWFVGKDVAGCLGYKNLSRDINRHVDEEDKITKMIPQYQNGTLVSKTLLINESGLYSLIMSSKLPSAKRFKRWVTAEVLPQIRKTGGYIPVDQGDSDLMIMAKALNIMQNTLADKDSIIKALQPKADFADCMLKCNNSISVGEFAKVITDNGFEIGRNRLFKYLRDQHYLMKNNIPYQRYMKNDIFQLKEGYHFEGSEYIQDFTTLITPKGQEYLYGKIKDDIQQGRFVA